MRSHPVISLDADGRRQGHREMSGGPRGAGIALVKNGAEGLIDSGIAHQGLLVPVIEDTTRRLQMKGRRIPVEIDGPDVHHRKPQPVVIVLRFARIRGMHIYDTQIDTETMTVV